MKEPAASAGERLTRSRYDLMKIAATLDGVIPLGVGDPDLATSHDIIRRTTLEVMGRRPSGDPRGLPELRQAVAVRYRRGKGLTFDPQSEILVTNGAQEGLFLAVMALVNPGDEVLLPDPRYSSYDQAVEAAGGLVVEVPTDPRRDFKLEAREVRARGTSAKLLIFPNPSNPTGALVSSEGVREIARAARELGTFVLSDEVYETLVYDGVTLHSMASCEGMRERTVTLSSVSKSYAMTGFRLGYLLGPPAFIEGATRLKAAISGPCPLYSQCAALAALAGPQDVTREILETLTGRRRVLMEGLDSIPIPYSRPGGAFFVWADVSRYGMPAEEFCRRVLLDARVLLFPGSAFGSRWKDYVRISFLQPEEKIAEAVSRIRRFAESLSRSGETKHPDR